MSENNDKKRTTNDADVLFGIPDTGVSVSWDFSAGCGTGENDKKGTNLRPVTPKAAKFSSKVYRRRVLNQVKLPTGDGDEAFAEQMLSLVSVSRKSIIKNSPGVSPKGRSPRNLRYKLSKPSPLRDENFHFLLNDSIENDDMIRCSQITEAALRDEEKKSPLVPKRGNSAKRLGLHKSVGGPLSRKKLLDAITLSQKNSALRQQAKTPPSVPSPPADTDPLKNTDQCNNNVRTVFGSSDDDELLANFLDDCSKVEKELPRKSTRLSLSQMTLPTGVTPIVHKQETNFNAAALPSISTKETTKNEQSTAICQDLDGMDFDLELSPHLLNLLDGHVEGGQKQSSPKVKGFSSKDSEILNTHQRSSSAKVLNTKTDPACTTAKADPAYTTAKADSAYTTAKADSAYITAKINPACTTAKAISHASIIRQSKQAGGQEGVSTTMTTVLSLSQSSSRAKEAVRPSNSLTRHASAPGLNRPLQPVMSIPNKGLARKCTPEEIERKRLEALNKLKRSQTK